MRFWRAVVYSFLRALDTLFLDTKAPCKGGWGGMTGPSGGCFTSRCTKMEKIQGDLVANCPSFWDGVCIMVQPSISRLGVLLFLPASPLIHWRMALSGWGPGRWGSWRDEAMIEPNEIHKAQMPPSFPGRMPLASCLGVSWPCYDPGFSSTLVCWYSGLYPSDQPQPQRSR